MLSRAMRAWSYLVTLITICALALVGGCAGGAWLERPLTAELPVEGPQAAYPTALPGQEGAVRSQETGDGATVVSSPGRPERQQANMPVLAVVPPQLVTHPAVQPAPNVAAVAAPQAQLTEAAPSASAMPPSMQPGAAPPVSRPATRFAAGSISDLDEI